MAPPELQLANIAVRPASAILFSGGGSRSFTATIGYLAALTELGLLDSTRYISGVSGGSWATVLYAFSNSSSNNSNSSSSSSGGGDGSISDVHSSSNVTLLLGNTTFPENMTAATLPDIPAGCARRAAVDLNMLHRLLVQYLGKSNPEYAWVEVRAGFHSRRLDRLSHLCHRLFRPLHAPSKSRYPQIMLL